MTLKSSTAFPPVIPKGSEPAKEVKGDARKPTADTESAGTPADGDVLREAIFHEGAMEPIDNLPGY